MVYRLHVARRNTQSHTHRQHRVVKVSFAHEENGRQ